MQQQSAQAVVKLLQAQAAGTTGTCTGCGDLQVLTA